MRFSVSRCKSVTITIEKSSVNNELNKKLNKQNKIKNKYTARDSFSSPSLYMVFFDIQSLFTNIPLMKRLIYVSIDYFKIKKDRRYVKETL